MLTPKAALGALALALALVAGTVQAESSAYRPEYPSPEQISEKDVAGSMWLQLSAMMVPEDLRGFEDMMLEDDFAEEFAKSATGGFGSLGPVLPVGCSVRVQNWAGLEMLRLMMVGYEPSSISASKARLHARQAVRLSEEMQHDIEARGWTAEEAACVRFMVHSLKSMASLIQLLN